MRNSKTTDTCRDGQCAPVTSNTSALDALNLTAPQVDSAVADIDKALATKARNEEFATCKPSRMLEMAMEDLAKVQADPQYMVDMGTWHTPWELYGGAVGTRKKADCVVCLAGSVMAKSLECAPEDELVPCSDHFGDDNLADRLDALDTFRGGYIHSALGELVAEIPEGLPYSVEVTSYHHGKGRDYKRFVKDMNGIIDLLRKFDL